MSSEKINAEVRTEFGKGAARRIRRADKVPAVVYGQGNEPIHLSLPGHETKLALRDGGANALLELSIDGEELLALAKDIQVDPIRRVLEHVDFVAVKRGEKVTVDVPIVLIGDVVSDGFVQVETQTVQLEAEATHIPESVEVSIEGVEIGTQITAGDLTLPAGSILLTDADDLIVNVTLAKEEPAEAPEAAEGETAEGDAAEGEAAEGGDEE